MWEINRAGIGKTWFNCECELLKTKNPREFWKVIKTETTTKQSQFNATLFVEFVDHFRELNSDPLFSDTVPPLYNPVITGENEPINRPFFLEEVKLAIRKFKKIKKSQWC